MGEFKIFNKIVRHRGGEREEEIRDEKVQSCKVDRQWLHHIQREIVS